MAGQRGLFSKFSRFKTVLLSPAQFCPLEQHSKDRCFSSLLDSPRSPKCPPAQYISTCFSELFWSRRAAATRPQDTDPSIPTPAFQAAESTGNRPHILFLPSRTKSHVDSCQDNKHLLCVEDTAVSHGAPGTAQRLGGKPNVKLARGAGCFLGCKE